MSVQYYGWEVTYDDASPRKELQAAQEPKDRGVYTMYHGTTIASARLIIANGFKQSSGGMLGRGVYVSRDKKKADRYPLYNDGSDRVVFELRVKVGRVKRIDIDNHPMQKTWNANGYDTAWVPPNCGMKAVPSGLEEDCVYDPKNVKVAAISSAPATVLQELQQLLANSLQQSPVENVNTQMHGGGAEDVCSMCRRKTPQGCPHIQKACWGCGQNICTLMAKHVCKVRQIPQRK
ncbi:uncharacterized protein V6R79_023052 [Siganus canaliculatus]